MESGRNRLLDAYLVAAARTGDGRAFEALVRRWQSRLIAHAWRLLGSAEQARDAVQEAWSEIARGLGRLHDEKAFAAWAFRIVSRRCARQVRSNQRMRAVGEAVAATPAETAPEEVYGGREVDRLRTAIRHLPPEQRAAVALFYFEDLSVAEVAVALDTPAGTIKTRLMHARRKLRAELEGDIPCGT
jgi:RNA polymerase sigma-70 factor (ECF subfamily)